MVGDTLSDGTVITPQMDSNRESRARVCVIGNMCNGCAVADNGYLEPVEEMEARRLSYAQSHNNDVTL